MAVSTPDMPASPGRHGSWKSFWALRVDLCVCHTAYLNPALLTRHIYVLLPRLIVCHWLKCAITFNISAPLASTSIQFSMALDLHCIILGFSNFSTCCHIPAFTHLISLKKLWWLTFAFQAMSTLVGLHSQNDSHLRTSICFPRFILRCRPSSSFPWIPLTCLSLSSPARPASSHSHNSNVRLSPQLTGHFSQSLQLLSIIKLTLLMKFSAPMFAVHFPRISISFCITFQMHSSY